MIESKSQVESQGRFQRQAKYSGLPLITLSTHRLFNFVSVKGTGKAYQTAIDFIAIDDENKPKREHHFLTFGGDPGRGKTHLALGIGWHWLYNNMGIVLYFRAEQLLDVLRKEYDESSRNRIDRPSISELEFTQKVGLLILDDLGAEKVSEWAIAKLDELIDYRYINELPTVFTTNLLLTQLPQRIGSRLREGTTVLLDGLDYREYKARMRKVKTRENTKDMVR